MDPQKQERISIRAYRIWEEAGRPDGKEAEHWHQAEAEIEAEDDAERRPRQTPTEPSSPELPPKANRSVDSLQSGAPAAAKRRPGGSAAAAKKTAPKRAKR
jgi:hypothetical protein